MNFKPVILWTDVVMWLMVVCLVWYIRHVRRDPALRATWAKVFAGPAAMSSSVVLALLLAVTMVDSLHFRRALADAPTKAGTPAAQQAPAFNTRTESVLDLALQTLINSRENSYSAPLATHGFVKETVPPKPGVKPVLDANGNPALPKREFPRLKHGGAHLADSDHHLGDALGRGVSGAVLGAVLALLLIWLATLRYARFLELSGRVDDDAVDMLSGVSLGESTAFARIWSGQTQLAWRSAMVTVLILFTLMGAAIALSTGYHVLGTDRTGNDVLYQSIKSVRTAFVIGSLATIATLPLALLLGIAAGYFKGWVDDAIQYLYTVLSSVPNILLIAACVLMVQVFLDKHPELFETGLERADLKIFLLCIILGLTGWAGLCRLLRAETLKLRELEYVQAATAFGAGPWRIMRRHILPNVMHLVLITTVLEFSGLILYEAVLSYVGVGVDPSMNSFGGMINQARVEMSRDPLVWWSFAAAFVFMVAIVLAANLLADAVRDAFDPRARVHRPRHALALQRRPHAGT
jgi:peptide/nickel transport system permease protein